MTATVRLDDDFTKKLENLSLVLHKKKSDVIRDAISFYAKSIENSQTNKIKNAIQKTKQADIKLNKEFESTLNDNI